MKNCKTKRQFLLQLAINCCNFDDGSEFEWDEIINGGDVAKKIEEFYGIECPNHDDWDLEDEDDDTPDAVAATKRIKTWRKAYNQVHADVIQLLKELRDAS